jgi:hypothetical protein
MRPNSDDFQSTPLTPAPDAPPTRAGAAEAAAAAAGAPVAPPPTPTGEPRKIGVVLVHGIGAQTPGEFFLEATEPLVRLLGGWRASLGLPIDPVRRSELSFSGASRPYLEIDIPPQPGDTSTTPATWIITEAWWATDLRPPSVGEATRYLRSRIGTIVRGISDGFSREDRWQKRRNAVAESETLAGDWRAAELGQQRWAWIPIFEKLQLRFTRYALLPTIAPSFLALLIWAPLRALPIGPLREFAEARLVDTFLTDWFGDLPILLDDRVQSANVRARLAGTVEALRQLNCDAIVLVAHSGGAIVSFETLLDGQYRDAHIDKLVTLGQGLSLGWRLEGAYKRPLPLGDRLRGDPRDNRPDIRWTDFWASYDPAPAGRLTSPDLRTIPVVSEDPHRYEGDRVATDETDALLIEDRPVTNLMSLFDDHGGYWENDEGFLVALVRQIDRPRGDVDASRFYRDPLERAVRIEWRRTRVATLAAWRWVVGLGMLVAVLLAGARPFDGTVWNAGASVQAVWGVVPGHELISGPIEAIGTFAGLIVGLVAGGDQGTHFATAFGVLLTGAITIALLFTALFAIGLIGWRAWDATERALARAERLVRTDRRPAAACLVALLGGLALLAYIVVAARNPAAAPIAIALWVASAIAAGLVLLQAMRTGADRST